MSRKSEHIKEISMITIKTIKKKFLEQIRVISAGVTWAEMIEDLLHDKPSRVVRGWINGSLIGMPSEPRVWLVHGPGPDEWQLVTPPSQGAIGDSVRIKYQDIPQLFID